MTKRHSRMITLLALVALTLVICMIPGALNSAAMAEEGETTGTITNGGTNFREGPGKKYYSIMKLDRGTVVSITSIPDEIGEDYWYGVSYAGKKGYVNSEYVRVLTGNAASKATVSPTASPTPPPSTDGYNAVELILTSCHLRISANGDFDRDNDWEGKGSVLPLAGTAVSKANYVWYPVEKGGKTYYVRNDCVKLVKIDDKSISSSSSATPAPSSKNSTSSSSSGYGTVTTIMGGCNLRATMGGTMIKQIAKNVTLTVLAKPTTKGGYTWYYVNADGDKGYLRSDVVKYHSSGQSTSTSTTNNQTTNTANQTTTTDSSSSSASSGSGYGTVTTIMGGCNLRATMGGTMIKQIPKNVTLTVLEKPTTKGGYTWYYVNADGNKGYLRSDVVKYSSGGTASTTTSAGTTTTNSNIDSNATGYVMTTSPDVNLRIKAGYTSLIGKIKAKGTVMPYYGQPTTVKGVTWYNVRDNTLGMGYVHGSYVNIVNSDGSATPTPVPTEAPAGTVVSSSTSQVEASYSTLKVGSTGTAVKNLVQALKDRGYYSGTVTNKYTTAVEKAVRAFQKAQNLSVDGIAGPATQHALYGTVPVGAADSSNLTMTLYPAEKIDWWTGGINSMWAKGTNYKIYDVKTGIVWWAHRWSGGYHADVEPLTAADTARLCKCYGVTTAQEIAKKNLYQRRPSLITIGNRTFACSLYGVPHNEAGDTIANNDMKGQVCIHFTNSWTHGSKNVDSLHTEAIQYAWEHAPNGHK